MDERQVIKHEDGSVTLQYPDPLKKYGRIGEIIWDCLGDDSITKTILKNRVYDKLFFELSQGIDFENILVELRKVNLIKDSK